jgi:hypothetical protein
MIECSLNASRPMHYPHAFPKPKNIFSLNTSNAKSPYSLVLSYMHPQFPIFYYAPSKKNPNQKLQMNSLLLHTQKELISSPRRRKFRHPARRIRQLGPLKLLSRPRFVLPLFLSPATTQNRFPVGLLRFLDIFLP